MAVKTITEILNGVTVFGGYTVIGEGGTNGKARFALCKCACGSIRKVAADKLRAGRSTCCYECAKLSPKRSISATKHGMSKSPEYSAWQSMIQRCTNSKSENYPLYGGRGISVCERWLKSFDNFISDMGPAGGLTLDRIDVNGDYEPSNCRWASRIVQQSNRRRTLLVDVGGVMVASSILARASGISAATFASRIAHGMSVDAAMSKPVENRRPIHIVDGVQLTASNIFEKYGIPRGRLNYNLRKGMSAQQVVDMYRRNRKYG